MNPKKIVITGGPSTGKTSLIAALEKSGYFCFHEVIRLMTLEAKEKGKLSNLKTNPIATVSDPKAFNQKIITARLAQYTEAESIEAPIVFFDRGIPDVLAYMDFFKQPYDTAFHNIARDNRYDAIFLLPIWEEIFVSDSERFESFEASKQIHNQLKNTYTSLGYKLTEIPADTIENRVQFILNQLKEC